MTVSDVQENLVPGMTCGDRQLYEVIPVGVKDEFSQSVDPLKYQKRKKDYVVNEPDELMTIKFRYKKPDGDVSKLILFIQQNSKEFIDKGCTSAALVSAVVNFICCSEKPSL